MPEIYVPPMGPPQGPPPDPALYRGMGESGITRMLQDFYRELGRSPIAHLFPQGEEALMAAASKSALFFVGVCGGPPLYAQRIGPPRMRARHLPFAIDAGARQAWLDCWNPVLKDSGEKYGLPQAHLPGFRAFLEGFSAWMVNRAG
jgi:hemoglobin